MNRTKVEVEAMVKNEAMSEAGDRARVNEEEPEDGTMARPRTQPELTPLSQPQPRPSYLSFRVMPVWKQAIEVAEQVHAATDKLPRKEDCGFTSQIRRAALSVSANIAEAFGRSHSLDKTRFYCVARGSLTETQSHLEYGKRVGYLSPATAQDLSEMLDKIHAEINGVISSLRKSAK